MFYQRLTFAGAYDTAIDLAYGPKIFQTRRQNSILKIPQILFRPLILFIKRHFWAPGLKSSITEQHETMYIMLRGLAFYEHSVALFMI